MSTKRLLLLAALALLIAPVACLASSIIDFGLVTPTSGSISYAGGASPLVGTGLDVDSLAGIGTPANSGISFGLIGGYLNFTTGNFNGNNSTTWDFGSGGNITITGCVDVDNDGGPCDTSDISGTLLSGVWTSAKVISFGTVFKITGGSFLSVQNPALLAFYGLSSSSNPVQGNLNLSFDAGNLPPNAFTSSTVLSGDVASTLPVPEPATLALLGTGLIGIAGIVRLKGRHVKGL